MSLTNEYQGGKDFRLLIGYAFAGAVTFQNSGDTVTFNNHGLAAGDVVRFSAVTGPTAPVANTNYYVVNPTTNTFQIAATRGGSPIAIDVDGTGTAVEAFEYMAAIRSTQFSLSSEEIDVTTHDDAQNRVLLDEAGITSATISGSGVYKDEYTFAKARGLCLARKLNKFRVQAVKDGSYWEGVFKITSIEQSGDYNAEHSFSISLSSSGALTYTNLP